MRHILLCSLAFSLLTAPAHAEDLLPVGQGDARIRPDARLTPGAVTTSDPAVFCHTGYSRSARYTSGRVKRDVYRAYGIDRRHGHYAIDHLVPLALGGADVPANLCPEERDDEWGPWQGFLRDPHTACVHSILCASNPIEGVFATVRNRTIRTKGALSQDTARLMVFKLAMTAARTWRRLKGESQLPEIVQGVTFRNGLEGTDMPAQSAA